MRKCHRSRNRVDQLKNPVPTPGGSATGAIGGMPRTGRHGVIAVTSGA